MADAVQDGQQDEALVVGDVGEGQDGRSRTKRRSRMDSTNLVQCTLPLVPRHFDQVHRM